MAKRGAQEDLTRDNWDQEYEEEEAGVFRLASKEVIQTREIRKAKRRLGNEDNAGGTGAGGIFKGITFGVQNSSTAGVSKPFSFSLQPSTATSTTTGSSPAKKHVGFSFTAASTSALTSTVATTSLGLSSVAKSSCPTNSSAKSTSPETESLYRQDLRCLNESVVRWIDNHVKKNPYCILTPVFNDYEKYIKELNGSHPDLPANMSGEQRDAEKIDSSTSVASSADAAVTTAVTTAATGFSFAVSSTSPASGTSTVTTSTTTSNTFGAGFFHFGTKSANDENKATVVAPASSTSMFSGFSFSTATPSTASSSGAGFIPKATTAGGSFPSTGGGFSFGVVSKETTAKPASGFSFGIGLSKDGSSAPAAGFGFSVKVPGSDGSEATETAAGPSQSEGGDDENYVPPKTDVVDIKEDDAFYTVRCKLYFKINKEFQDRGVGNLYLKPCGEKTQLLVRAGTTLGNVLLNIILSKSIPTSRQGNKVTMVCIPNPPLSEKDPNSVPICMLIRVKTDEDAEALLQQINDHKV